MNRLYKKIEMRTDCDCMVACLAMLLQCDYESAAQFFPAIAINKKGYNWEYLTPFLKANGIYLSWMPTKNEVNWNKPAMLDVASLTAPEKGEHIIFWDGERVIDPSRKELKYTDVPFEINCGYQINENWTKLPIVLPVPSPENAVILTEEEIEKFINNEKQYYGSEAIACMQYAIKWALSKVQPIDLKQELIKFAKHIAGKDFPYAICHGEDKPFATSKDDFTCDEIVDIYLHKPEEGK